MNIVYEILRKLTYLKPKEFYNDKILEYFFTSNLANYFQANDNYEITINIKNNNLEITNLTTHEEYLILKNDNKIDFINKLSKEILFHIRIDADKISCISNDFIKTIKCNKDSETYLLMTNNNGQIITLANLKVKISNKDYFELKINNQKSKIVGILLDDYNKYEQIFNYLETKINRKQKARKRLLFS